MNNTVIIGTPGSGKTVLLSVMTRCKVKDGSRIMHPLNRYTMDFIDKQMKLLLNKQWPKPTLEAIESPLLDWELKWNDCPSMRLMTRDFAGEVWNNFLNKYGNKDNNFKLLTQVETDKNIQHITTLINNASSIIILLDLTQFINKSDSTVDQEWTPIAIKNYLEKINRPLKNVAIVLTKFDQYKDMISDQNNYMPFIKDHSDHIYDFIIQNSIPIFPVAAVCDVVVNEYNYEVPANGFSTSGITSLLNWIKSNAEKQQIPKKKINTILAIYCVIGLGICISGNGTLLALWLLFLLLFGFSILVAHK